MMSTNKTPKVFLSHASEDKDRFVLKFAERLRSKGIDVWLDKWEMNPGDSLIDKIFEDGISNADVIIVVLSKHSVCKPWVREELNVSMIKKIEHDLKLIPIALDNCKIPECLLSTVREFIKDIDSYDTEFDRIVSSIHGHYDKPNLGEPPKYVQTIVSLIPGLTKPDSLTLKLSCEKGLASNDFNIDTINILKKANLFDIAPETVLESIEILDGRGYLECKRKLGGDQKLECIPKFRITTFGFEEYANTFIEDYKSILMRVGSEIINNKHINSFILEDITGYSPILIAHIINLFELHNFITVSKEFCGRIRTSFNYISPELKRFLNNSFDSL